MLMEVRGLLAVLLVVLLSGCSVKIGYNNIDRIIRWGVNDYIDLNFAQKEVLERELDLIHSWHRKNHLPQYAAVTRELARKLPDGVSVVAVVELNEQFEFWSDEVEALFSPLVVDIMSSLSDEQVSALPARMAESNAEWAEDESDRTLRAAQLYWAEQFGDVLKNFTGRLNKSQKTYLERRSLEYQPERVMWSDYRHRFQMALMELLDVRQDKPQFATAYRVLVAKRKSFYGDELTAVFENNQRLNHEVTAHILSNLTEKQSAKFVDELLDLGEDFTELATEV
jgi:hypothetical protein